MARTRPINVRLIHDGVQPGPPLPEALRFGLQDNKGEVHPGVARPDGAQIFDLVLDVKAAEAPGVCVAADVIGRRPHSSAAIVWRIEPMGTGAF